MLRVGLCGASGLSCDFLKHRKLALVTRYSNVNTTTIWCDIMLWCLNWQASHDLMPGSDKLLCFFSEHIGVDGVE